MLLLTEIFKACGVQGTHAHGALSHGGRHNDRFDLAETTLSWSGFPATNAGWVMQRRELLVSNGE
jgi:hypothetical protein